MRDNTTYVRNIKNYLLADLSGKAKYFPTGQFSYREKDVEI